MKTDMVNPAEHFDTPQRQPRSRDRRGRDNQQWRAMARDWQAYTDGLDD